MNDSLVSVIIPTYKRPDMVLRAIHSVLKQTYSNIEIIVVDDNGLGNEFQLKTAENLKTVSENIKYIVHEVNKGGSSARNTGWKNSSGEFITFLDDDDEISDRKIECQVSCLMKHDCSWGACYSAYHVLKQDGSIQKSSHHKEGDVYLQALMRTMFMGSGSNLLLRKSVVDQVRGYDESFVRNQDIEFMTRVFEKYKLAFVNEDLLEIHFEIRQYNRPYSFYKGITQYYLTRFKSHIEELNKEEKKRVIEVISLEQARCALSFKKYREILYILSKNKVRITSIIKYLYYLIYRYKTNESFGFFLEK